MINVNADKEYVVSFMGEDQDGNPVALPQGAVNLSLSDPSAGQLIDNGDGTFTLDPDKVGQYNLSAESNGLLGSADINIEAGALFKISVNVSEKQVPQEEPVTPVSE